MARAKRAGDTARNARRRFVRQGKRYLQKAQQAIGAAKSRYQVLAQDMLENAVSLYSQGFDRAKVEKPIQELAQELNVDISTIKPTENKLESVAESFESLASNIDRLDERTRREREAKAILNQGNIKNRFYGGLVDIWEGLPKDERNQAILEHFGKDSLMDILEDLESAGIDIYSAPNSDEMYDTGKLKVARYATKF